MAEWIHTSFSEWGLGKGCKFTDTWCRWHFFSAAQRRGRGLRIGDRGEDYANRATEFGRRPYVDGANWGVKSDTEKRSGRLVKGRGISFTKRRSRGNKI